MLLASRSARLCGAKVRRITPTSSAPAVPIASLSSKRLAMKRAVPPRWAVPSRCWRRSSLRAWSCSPMARLRAPLRLHWPRSSTRRMSAMSSTSPSMAPPSSRAYRIPARSSSRSVLQAAPLPRSPPSDRRPSRPPSRKRAVPPASARSPQPLKRPPACSATSSVPSPSASIFPKRISSFRAAAA